MRLHQRVEVPEDQKEAYESVRIGMVLYGTCGGRFVSMGDNEVVHVTTGSVIVRNWSGELDRATVEDWNDLVRSSNDRLQEILEGGR